MHAILEHHEIRADLTERCTRLAEAHSSIFGNSDGNAVVRAGALCLQLAEPGGHRVAIQILANLVPEQEWRGTDFWGTPLGRACGWWTGAGQLDSSSGNLEIATPTPRVGLLLGMSRQAAHEMVVKGKLKKVTAAGVRPEDVRREMQARFPL